MTHHPRNIAGPHRPSLVEPITRGELWPVALLHIRCGMGPRARAKAFQEGLPVFSWGNRLWVSSDDVIDFLMRHQRPVADQADRVQDNLNTNIPSLSQPPAIIEQIGAR